nr:zinc finger protein 292-like [Monopterus albus]
MAEEASAYELEGLENQLENLLSCYSSDALRVDSKLFCSEFCKLVEEYASHWQVPLPQLRILEIALVYFTQASSFFTSNCDHVVHTLSSLAL